MSIFSNLIEQSIKPKGYTGRIMLKIMNAVHKRIFIFGIENINVSDDCKLLDLGFGGGKALKLLSKKYTNMKLYCHFDIITTFQTHYHWQDLDRKLKEIYRVLNKNSQFVIVAEKYKLNYHMCFTPLHNTLNTMISHEIHNL